ncbi:hypothetical protein [Calothrix sp. CCY 0018]|uniref:hypothetical protein n=1 Tax=Calothrix sp. CCY 0018 TaxID=3103864 RepID=UPI0039C620A2
MNAIHGQNLSLILPNTLDRLCVAGGGLPPTFLELVVFIGISSIKLRLAPLESKPKETGFLILVQDVKFKIKFLKYFTEE